MASASVMNFPCLVFPYQWSPSRWKTFVSVLTQTISLAGGCCGVPAAASEAVLEVFFAEAAGGAAGGGSEVGAERLVAGAIEDEVSCAELPFAMEPAADAVTRGLIFSIVDLETPARERSPAEE